jgi:hypothetical protein
MAYLPQGCVYEVEVEKAAVLKVIGIDKSSTRTDASRYSHM